MAVQIQLQNLTKEFGPVVAVDNMSLDIEKGEFITLLGPSGSGKTTTLMMIAGFYFPTQGEIIIESEQVTRKPPHKRNIGIVFQSYALFPHKTVFENIAFPLQIRKQNQSFIGQKVSDVLRLTELEGLEHRYPRQLSGGQQQRVALARALVFEPPVLLMDEPLGALDKKLREYMQLELKHIQEELNITIVYVTHDQEEALTMSHRIAVMNEGRIEQLGDRDALYERPVNPFIADFIGGANFMEGELISEEAKRMKFKVGGNYEVFAIASEEGCMANKKQASLAVRPGKLMMGDFRTGEEMNVFDGRVADAIHLADMSKYSVVLGPEMTFLVKMTSSTGAVRYKKGDHVKIAWKPKDTLVLFD